MGILATGADRARRRSVSFSDDSLCVSLMDGRTISVPLVWYPRLLKATATQRAKWQIAGGGYGIHWPEIDEDLSTEGLLRGARRPSGAEPNHLIGPTDSHPEIRPRSFAVPFLLG